MSHVRIVTDSTASLPPDLARELDIAIAHAFINFPDGSFREGLDLTESEFYAKLTASPALPTTSVPPPLAFEEIYRALGETGAPIISIHLSSRLSGMVNAATAAARDLPQFDITIVDSLAVSMGLGWLTLIAARMARERMSVAEIIARLDDAIPRVRLLTALDTLENIRRSGRITFPQAFIGTLLDIKPILEVRRDGIHPLDKVRTRRAALDRLVELATDLAPFEELAVLHANAPARADELRARLAAIHPTERILVTEAGAILGTHAGPGAIAFTGIVAKK
ncbi:MAG: DegV family protein [Chloroflexi bacterium]|nr:DegV family protein [Chloroflexota bacterium]